MQQTNNNEFGKTLKQIRESCNMSQDEFANFLGTSKQVISRYETSQRVPKITTVSEYAQKLDIPLEQFIDNNESGACPALGKQIMKFRKKKGLTQEQLGALLNKAGSTVRSWELGNSQPSPQTLCLLCDVLETTPNILLEKGERNCSDLSVLLLAEILDFIDKEYPSMTVQHKAELFLEYNKHNPIELLLSALNNEISNNKKR